MRIDFCIDNLGPGGAERIASLLVNRWAEQGHDVRLITLSDPVSDHYALDPRIRRLGLGLGEAIRSPAHGVWSTMRRLARLTKTLRADRPDVVVSFITRMNVLAILAGRLAGGVPAVVSERSNPEVHLVPREVALARRVLYRRAHAVVAQTSAVKDWIEQHCRGARVVVIPNPVADLPVVEETDPQLVVAAGRLELTKGFDLLLDAFALVHGRVPSARLRIYGEGPLRGELEEQARALGLGGSVEFPGTYEDVAVALGGAAVFVLSSRYEGFPNVLLEAMRVGTPSVAFDCPNGPRDLIRSGADGTIVGHLDVDALADAVTGALDDHSARAVLRRQARAATTRFSLATIGAVWDDLIDGACSTRG